MELRWVDAEDQPAVAGAVAVLHAAAAVDAPHLLAETVTTFAAGLRLGWADDPPRTAVLRDGRRRVVGVLQVVLPRWDNRHLALLAVTVDPAVRRRGLGRRLWEAGIEESRTAGRTVVLAEGWVGPATNGFAAALGLERVSEEAQRRLDVWTLDRSLLDPVRTEVAVRAADYDTLRLPEAVPPELVPGLLRVTESINDAPVDGLDIEDEVSSEERLRRFEAGQRARGRRVYRVAARHRPNGELAGHTLVAVDADHPWCGWQLDTSVLAAHRGHRLGLRLKIEMLDWLAEVEPQLRTLDTWNAVSNGPMVAINEQVGFRLAAHAAVWQLRL